MSRERLLKWLRRGALVTALVVLVPVVAVAIALRLEYAGDPGPAGRTRGHDAVWLGHAWVDGRHNAADLESLRAQVHGTGIRDLYVHTGPLEHNGSLDPKLYPGSARLLSEVHRVLPGVRVQAWLGDVISHDGGDDGLHLDDEATRARVQGSAQQVLAAGFDGVHLDLEPNYSGDDGFLDILDRVRTVTTAHGAKLSVATHQIDPLPGLHTVGHVFGNPKWWSQKYFGAVARRVDQVAVMAYDSSMPLESLFGGYLAQQTALALEVTPPTTDLIMGLPGYHTGTPTHHPSAETVRAAVRGARLGLARHGRDRETFGMALYVDFAATPGDWAAYRSGWGEE